MYIAVSEELIIIPVHPECICLSLYVCIHNVCIIYIYMYAYVYVFVHVHVHVHVYVYVYVCMCVCLYVYVCTHALYMETCCMACVAMHVRS